MDYPLPIDLHQTHSDILNSELNCLIFGGPFLTKSFDDSLPLRVLELCCDTGWWSATTDCHFQQQHNGHRAEFVGLDVKPIPTGVEAAYRESGMKWQFIQHDINDLPWPMADGSFDLVMARNLCLTLDCTKYSETVQEYVRVLKPGGILELWEQDTTIRALRPKVRDRAAEPISVELAQLGLYPVLDNSAFGRAADCHVADFNGWIKSGLADLRLPTEPCSYIEAMFGAHLVEGSEKLEMQIKKRAAVPLAGEPLIWEMDGSRPRELGNDQKAVRCMALEGLIALVEAFQPVLRTKSGANQAAWDAWLDKAKKDWLAKGGFAKGECLEFGAWSLRKRS